MADEADPRRPARRARRVQAGAGCLSPRLSALLQTFWTSFHSLIKVYTRGRSLYRIALHKMVFSLSSPGIGCAFLSLLGRGLRVGATVPPLRHLGLRSQPLRRVDRDAAKPAGSEFVLKAAALLGLCPTFLPGAQAGLQRTPSFSLSPQQQPCEVGRAGHRGCVGAWSLTPPAGCGASTSSCPGSGEGLLRLHLRSLGLIWPGIAQQFTFSRQQFHVKAAAFWDRAERQEWLSVCNSC